MATEAVTQEPVEPFGEAMEKRARELLARPEPPTDSPMAWRSWANDLTWIVPRYVPRLLATLDAELDAATVSREAFAGLLAAAANVSDRRTLDSDGFWVSKKEMRALDLAIAAARTAGSPAALPDTEVTE